MTIRVAYSSQRRKPMDEYYVVLVGEAGDGYEDHERGLVLDPSSPMVV